MSNARRRRAKVHRGGRRRLATTAGRAPQPAGVALEADACPNRPPHHPWEPRRCQKNRNFFSVSGGQLRILPPGPLWKAPTWSSPPKNHFHFLGGPPPTVRTPASIDKSAHARPKLAATQYEMAACKFIRDGTKGRVTPWAQGPARSTSTPSTR